MSANTKIEWADATINWWAGCTQISPACDNCYAKAMAKRLWGVDWGTGVFHQFQGAYASLMTLDRKAQRLGRPLRVFHNSLSDFFDNQVPAQWRIEAMRGIVDTPNLIHMLLTKRIGNAAAMLEKAFRAVHGQREGWSDNVLPNVWLGATICNQTEADRDITKLLAVRAAKRFLSMEPMLGRVYIEEVSDSVAGVCLKPLAGLRWVTNDQGRHETVSAGGRIDWVIVGGESGPNARPMHPDWVRSLRDQCQDAGVPFFFKQWGDWSPSGGVTDDVFKRGPAHEGQTWRIGKKAAGRLLDGRTWDEVPV